LKAELSTQEEREEAEDEVERAGAGSTCTCTMKEASTEGHVQHCVTSFT
jgi:hypothetical protein